MAGLGLARFGLVAMGWGRVRPGMARWGEVGYGKARYGAFSGRPVGNSWSSSRCGEVGHGLAW